MTPEISIVIPVYGCDSFLKPLYQRVVRAMDDLGLDFELIFVDDRGPGRPWEIITGLALQDHRVRGLRLSRNFGQHYAISAGIDHCRGKWLIVMDCDLQDLPEEIGKLWNKAALGYDIVVGRRVERQDGFFKRISSRIYHKVLSYMTDLPSDAARGNFGLYSGRVVSELKKMPETARMFPLLVRWLGFETAAVDVRHGPREHGQSSYTTAMLISLAADAIISHSNKPLKMFIKIGFAMSFLSFCFGLWIIAGYFFFYQGQTLLGWSSIMVSMYFLAGLMLSGMGVLGVYIGRIFNQVKGRPLYVVSEMTVLENNGHEGCEGCEG